MLRRLVSAMAFVLGISVTGMSAQTFTTLHTFNNTDGANPQAALIEDRAGNLYSTTEYGGAYQVGNAFKLSQSGTFAVLHDFGYPSEDGARPWAPLLADGHGNLYGTTYSGGSYCADYEESQCGTVFKIDSAGQETIVHSFTGGTSSSKDGANPAAGLITDTAGNLYGTTWGGYNGSVAYELTPSGNETILHQFAGGSDGITIYGPLVRDAAGNLWGTTNAGGGTTACSGGCGTVFELHKTSGGWSEKVTYRFEGGAGGAVPYAGLTYDAQRHVFYGTTQFGGGASGCMYLGNDTGCGVLFELDATGTRETVLHDFSGQADGGQPAANLILDSQGDLYGTTTMGGDLSCPSSYQGCGTVFVRSGKGAFATLHTFTGGADGAVPYGALLLDTKRASLYGTTTVGGNASCQTQEGGGPGCGTVFKIKP